MSGDDKSIPSNADAQGQSEDIGDVLADMRRSLGEPPGEEGASSVPSSFDDVFDADPGGPDTGWPEDPSGTVPPAFAVVDEANDVGDEAPEPGARIDIDLPEPGAGEPVSGHEPLYAGAEEAEDEASGSVVGEDYPPAVDDEDYAGDAVDGSEVTQALSNWVSGSGAGASLDGAAGEGAEPDSSGWDSEGDQADAPPVTAPGSIEDEEDDVPLVMEGGVDGVEAGLAEWVSGPGEAPEPDVPDEEASGFEETIDEEAVTTGGIPVWAKAVAGAVGLGLVSMAIYIGFSLLSGGASDAPAPQARRAPVHPHQAAPSAGSASHAASHPADPLKATAPSKASPAAAADEGASPSNSAQPQASPPPSVASQAPQSARPGQTSAPAPSPSTTAGASGPSTATDVPSPSTAQMASAMPGAADLTMPNLSGFPSGPGADTTAESDAPGSSAVAAHAGTSPVPAKQLQALIDSAVAKRTQTLEQRIKNISAKLADVEGEVSSSAKPSKASLGASRQLDPKTIAELRRLVAERRSDHHKAPAHKRPVHKAPAHKTVHHRRHHRAHHRSGGRRHYTLVGAVSGRAVLEHEGKTVTVSVGDNLTGYGRITRIGADGCVYAHKGVIRTPSATCPQED